MKFWKKKREKGKSSAKITEFPERREYIAEALEARILYSGAPVEVPIQEVVAPAESGTPVSFATLDGFGEAALPPSQDGASEESSEVVILTNFNNLTPAEVEELAKLSIDYWKDADLDESGKEALYALEAAVIDIVGLAEAYDFEFDSSEPGFYAASDLFGGDAYDFGESTITGSPEAVFSGVDQITDLLRELGDPVVLERFATEQIAARTVEVAHQPVTSSTLDFIADAAEQAWIRSGLNADQLAALESIEYHIVELDGLSLGYAEGSNIYIDDDAAGRGWYEDVTPWDNLEFVENEDGVLVAVDSAAADQMDLLSVVAHEVGHVIGLEDIYDADHDENLMFGGFTEGVRRLPIDGQAEDAAAVSLEGRANASATLTAAQTADVVNANGTVDSLREAISQAGDGDVITLAAGTFLMELDDGGVLSVDASVNNGTNENSNATGDFDINNKDIRIVGAGKDQTFIDAQQLDRVFHIFGGSNVTFQDLTIRGGALNYSHGAGFYVESGSTVNLVNVGIVDNVVQTADIVNNDRHGGGFWANQDSSVTGSNVDITGNVAQQYGAGRNAVGGGFWVTNGADVTLTDSLIDDNTAREGGGFYLSLDSIPSADPGSVVTLNNTDITDNTGIIRGGGFRNTGVGENGTVVINVGTISGNTAEQEHGGGFHNSGSVIMTDVVIDSNRTLDADKIAGGDLKRDDAYGGGFFNNTGGIVSIDGASSITGNSAFGNGGGFWNREGTTTITGTAATDVLISGNISYRDGADTNGDNRGGGGFVNSDAGTVNLEFVEITANETKWSDLRADETGFGAGFYNTGQSTVNLTDVWIHHQTETEQGGGFYQDGIRSQIIGTRVTIEDNFAEVRGGGFRNATTGGLVKLTDSFIRRNTADEEHGGGFYNNGEIDFDNVDITNNRTFDNPGSSQAIDVGTVIASIDGYGAGFYNGGGNVVIRNNSLIDSNSAFGHGGGFYNSGGTVSVMDSIIANNFLEHDPDTLNSSHWRIDRHGGGFGNFGDGTVNLTGVSLADNRTRIDSDGNLQSYGGGFYNADGSTVNISGESEIVRNMAEDGGGFYNTSTGSTVNITGTLATAVVIGGSATDANFARVRGGGFRTTTGTSVNLEYVTIDSNTVEIERGGGFYSDGGRITGSNVTLSNNKTTAASGSRQGGGGWISSYSEVELTDSLVSKNESTSNGGAFYVENGSLSLTGTEVSENYSAGSGGAVMATGSSVISTVDSTAEDNIARNHGGAFYITDDSRISGLRSMISGNLAGYEKDGIDQRDDVNGIGSDLRGGGLWMSGRSSGVIVDSSVDNNESARYGGGINMENETSLTLMGSSVTNNVTDFRGGGFRIASSAVLNATNSTISNNWAGFSRAENSGTITFSRDGIGGGMWIQSGGNVANFNHVTVAENRVSAGGSGGGGGIYSGGSINAENSIFYGNIGDAELAVASQDASDVRGAITLIGNTVLGTHNAGGGGVTLATGAVRITADPQLGALGDNGGATLPDGSSPLTHTIGATDSAAGVVTASSVAVDQAGQGRAAGSASAGAYEVAPVLTTLVIDELNVPASGISGELIDVSSMATSTGGGTITYSWEVTDSAGNSLVTPANGDTSSFTYTIPAGTNPVQVLNVTVTATDSVTNQVASQTATIAVVDPAACPDDLTPNIVGVITVTTADDTTDGDTSSVANLNTTNGTDGLISLREAILAANAETTAGTVVINFAPGINPTLAGAGGDNTAVAGDLDITRTNGAVSILGNGAALTAISGGGIDRVFDIRPNAVVFFTDLTITGGATATDDHGGGVKNQGATVFFKNVDIVDNDSTRTSDNVGGGVYTTSSGTSVGRVYMTDGSIADNTANSHGGGIYMAGSNVGESVLYLDGTLIDGNTASGAADRNDRDGGGLYITDDGNRITLKDVTVSDNKTDGTSGGDGGGALFTGADHIIEVTGGSWIRNQAGKDADTGGGDDADGGAFMVEGTRQTITFTDVTLGGALDASGQRVDGNIAEDDGGAFYMQGQFNTLNLIDVIIEGNRSNDTGGGFYIVNATETVNMTQTKVDGSKIINNFSATEHGGGFRNDGIVNITGSNNDVIDITGNQARVDGTLLVKDNPDAQRNNGDRVGGGFYATSNSITNLTDVLISGNIAYSRGGGFFASGGATVTIDSSATSTSGDATSFITKIEDNHAIRKNSSNTTLEGDGGGFYVESAGSSVNLTDVLIADNTAVDLGGGFYLQSNEAKVDLTRVDITGNLAIDSGGGFFVGSNGSIAELDTVLIDKNRSTTEHGGGFYTAGIVNGKTVTITNNKVGFDLADTETSTGGLHGGGYYNTGGRVTLEDAVIEDNIARQYGGGFMNRSGGTTEITSNLIRSSISNNEITRSDSDGGGFWNAEIGSVSLTGVDIKDNVAFDEGGGFYNTSEGSLVALSDVLIDGNEAGDEGGGFKNAASFSKVTLDNVQITNNRTLKVHGGGFRNSGQVTGQDVVVSNNTAGTNNQAANNNSNSVGGGFYSSGTSAVVDLQRVEITDNDSHGRGGGIYNANGAVSLTDFILSRNTADSGTSESLGRGGGIWNSSSGDISLKQGEVSFNESYGHGAGINQQDTGSSVTMENVTISNNTAGIDQTGGGFVGERVGGGIWLQSSGLIAMNHVTITANRTTRNAADSGAGFRADTGNVTMENSIVFGNFRDVDNTPDVDDIDNNIGTRLQMTGNNIIGQSTGTMTNTVNPIISDDPLFEVLADNGGVILPSGGAARTHALGDGSAAIDVASSSTVTLDQRGALRDAAPDLGAFEVMSTVYVDDAWVGTADGTAITDGDLGTTGDQPAVFGVNAFATIQAAINAVATGGAVIVNDGTYLEDIALADGKTLEITGPDTPGTSETVTIQSITNSDDTAKIIIEGDSELFIGDDTTASTFAGVISGTGSLTKVGTEALTLTGKNEYSGGTTLKEGTLTLNAVGGDTLLNTGSLYVGTPLSINSGDFVLADAAAAANNVTLNVLTDQTVDDLSFVQPNTGGGKHTAQIDGVLTVTGSFLVSTKDRWNLNNGIDSAGAPPPGSIEVDIDGTGSIVHTGNEFTVTNRGAFPLDEFPAVLDLSGLASFSTTTNNFRVGIGNGMGQVTLSPDSDITATRIDVGTSGNSTAHNSYLYLHQNTDIQADTIYVGSGKNRGEISFAAGLTGLPAVTIDEKSGGGGGADLFVDHFDKGESNALGNIDFSGGAVTGIFDTIILGETTRSNGGGSGTTEGQLIIGDGTTASTLTANTITIAQTSADEAPAPAADTVSATDSTALGSLTVNTNATVTVGTLNLGVRNTNTLGGNTEIDSYINLRGGAVNVTTLLDLDGSATHLLADDDRVINGYGTLTVASMPTFDGVITPGANAGDIGTITINGNPELRGSLEVDISGVTTPGTDYDHLVVNGGVDVDGSVLVLNDLLTGATNAGDVITLIANDGVDSVTGEFGSIQGATDDNGGTLADGDIITFNGESFKIFYGGGTGNDVVLVNIATPGVIYVDDDFSGNGGQTIADADLGTVNPQPAIFGVNAFNTLADAILVAGANSTIILNAGTYNESIALSGTQILEITGPDAAGTVTISSLSSVAGTEIKIEGSSTLDVFAGSVQGVISGTGNLQKTGAGTLALSGDNKYEGTTLLSLGVLSISHDNALGDPASVSGTTIDQNNSAIGVVVRLDLSGDITVSKDIEFINSGADLQTTFRNASGDNTITGSVTLPAWIRQQSLAGSLTFEGGVTSAENTFYVINSSGGSTHYTTNPINLNSGTFYADSGGLTTIGVAGNSWASTTFSSGTLRLDVDNALPSNTTFRHSGLGYGSGGTLDLNGTTQEVASLFSGSNNTSGLNSVVANTNNATPASLKVSQASNTTYYGSFKDDVALEKDGAGTLTLSGTVANTHTGLTTVSGGTLALNKTGVNAIAGDGSPATSDVLVENGATLLNVAADQIADDACVTLNYGIWDLDSNNEAILCVEGTTVSSTNQSDLILNGATLTLNRLDWDNSGAPVSTVITDNTGELQFIPDGATQPVFETAHPGSVFVDSGVEIAADSLTFRATTFSNVLRGQVSGAGKLIFDPSSGSGGLTLENGANDYSGGTEWTSDSGTSGNWDLFTVRASGALGTGDVTINGGNQTTWTSGGSVPSSFIFTNGTTHTNNFVLTGNAVISISNPNSATASTETVSLTGNVDLGGNTLFVRGTGTGTIGGNISGTGGITKIDNPGTWILNGANTYDGATNVNAGTLLVNDNNALAKGAVTVADGADLGGTGTIGGAVTIVTGADLQPGENGTGTLTISSNTIINGDLEFDINGATTDRLNVVGIGTLGDDVTLGTNSTVTFNVISNPTASLITVIDNDGTADQISTVFSNYAEGEVITFGGTPYKIFYKGGDGNDVVLAEVTTPDTIYVDDSFTQNDGQTIDDADLGEVGDQNATYKVNAFRTLTEALSVAGANTTIILNGGDYSAEEIELTGTQTLEITGPDSSATVTIGSLSSSADASIIIEGDSILELSGATDDSKLEGTVTATTGKLLVTGGTHQLLNPANSFAATADIQVESGGELIVGTIGTASGLGSAEVMLNDNGSMTLEDVSPPTPSPTSVSVSANMQAWYDASTLTALSDGDAVTAWADQSGNNRDLESYTGTPTLAADEFNGHPAVRFNGNNENLQMADPSKEYFAKDVFIVFRAGQDGATPNRTTFGPDWGAPIGVKDGDNNDRTWMLQGNEDRFWNSELPSGVRRNGVEISSANNFDMGGIDAGEYMILNVTAGPLNGTQVREYIVGTRTDAWANSRFDTAEIIAFDVELSDADRDIVEAYLSNKYIGNATTLTNDVTVSGSATITINTEVGPATFGDLTIAAGATLTVDGETGEKSLEFASTTLGGGDITLNTGNRTILTLPTITETASTNLNFTGDGCFHLTTDNAYSGETVVGNGSSVITYADYSLGGYDPGFTEVWQLGTNTNNWNSFGGNTGDEHYYFAGTYTARADGSTDLTPAVDEAVTTFERELTNADPSNFIHFNLPAGDLNNDFRLELDFGTSWFPTGAIPYEVLVNGVPVFTGFQAADGDIRTVRFNGTDVSATTGDNVIEIKRTDTDLGGRIGLDNFTLLTSPNNTTNGGTTVEDGGALAVGGGTSIDEVITISGTGNAKFDAAIVKQSGGNTALNGPITLAGDARIHSINGNELDIRGGIAMGANSLTLDGDNRLDLDSELTGTGDLFVVGSDRVDFHTINSAFTGNVTVGAAGIGTAESFGRLDVHAGDGALGVSNTVTIANGSDAGIILRNNLDHGNDFVISGDGRGTEGAIRMEGSTGSLTGNLLMTGDATIYTNNGTLTIENAITGGGFTLSKEGTNTVSRLILNESNPTIGNVELNHGVIRILKADGLGQTASLDIDSDEALEFDFGAIGPVTYDGSTTLNTFNVDDGRIEVLSGEVTLDETFNLNLFVTGDMTIGGDGDLNINTTFGSGTGIYDTDFLNHYGFDRTGDDRNSLNLHNNGGMLNGGNPSAYVDFVGQNVLTGALDFDSDADFLATGTIDQSDNYKNLFIGYLNTTETGTFEFRNSDRDDWGTMFVDIDQDGIFESTTGNLGSNNGEQLAWINNSTFSVNLTNPLGTGRYLVAFTHLEGGGGSRIEYSFKTPSMASQAVINPGDPTQAGLWTGFEALIIDNNVVKIGNGTTTLAGDNSYNGNTTVNAGTLEVSSDTAMGTGEGDVTVNTGATLAFSGDPADLTVNVASLTVGGVGAAGQSGALVNLSGDNTLNGDVTVYGPDLKIANVLAGTELTLNGAVDMGVSTLAVDGAGDITLKGDISGTDAGVDPGPIAINGLQAWYDASTLTLNDGDLVTAWADQSGNGRDLISYTGTPTFETNEINGLPAVRFNANNENLQMAYPGNEYFAGDVYLVFRSGNGSLFGPDWGAPIGVKDSDDADRMWMLQGNTDRFWGGEPPSAVTRNGVAVPSTDNFDMGHLEPGGNIDAGQYMVLQVATGPGSGTQVREYIIGTRTDAWANSRFDTAEVLAFDHALSAEEKAYVENYLGTKYGVTGSFDSGAAVAFSNDIVKTGAGALTLAGDNTYSGEVLVEAGTLVAASDTALGDTTGETVVADGAVLALDNTCVDDADNNLLDDSAHLTITGETITLNGNGTGDGALVNVRGNNTIDGSVSIIVKDENLGELGIGNTSAGETLTVDADIDLRFSKLNTFGDGDITINGVVSAANTNPSIAGSTGLYEFEAAGETFTGYVEYDGTDTWLLIGRGREGWEFDIDGQGSPNDVYQNLRIPAGFAPAAFSDAIVNDLLSAAGATMANVEMRISRASSLDGTGEFQEVRWSDFTGNANAFTFNFEDSPYGVTQSVLNAPAGLQGAEILNVPGKNTRDSNGGAIGNDADRVFTWLWSSHDAAGFSYGSSVSNGNDGAGSYLYENTNENHAIPYSEVYIRVTNGSEILPVFKTDNNDLTKSGNGTLTLNAANTYTGTTDVQAGSLIVNGSHTGGDNYTVAPAATLGGNGTVTLADDTKTVTVGAGAIVSPGDPDTDAGIGSLNLQNNTTISGELDFQINGNTSADLLDVDGTVTLGGTLDLEELTAGTGSVDVGTTITVIDNDGAIATSDADLVSGIFTGQPEGSTVTDDDGDDYVISYVGNDGNDVVLFAGTPETQVALSGGVLSITDITSDSVNDISVSFDATANTYTISETDIANVIGTSGVTVISRTANSITVDAAGITDINIDTTGPTTGFETGDKVTVLSPNGPVSVSGNVSISADVVAFGSGAMAGSITTAGGTVTVTAADEVTMSNGSLINTGSGAISISADNNITLGGLQTSGTATVNSAAGNIIDGGLAHKEIIAGSAVLTAVNVGEGNALETQISNLEASTTGNFTIDNMGPLNIGVTGGLTVGGNLNLTNNAAITDSQVTTVTGTSAISAGVGNDITLDEAGNDFGGTITIVSGNNVTLADSNGIDLGTSAVVGNLDISAGGDITDSGTLSVGGTTGLDAGAGNDITFDTAGNNFIGAVSIGAGKDVLLVDVDSIDLGASTISGNLNIDADGAITDSGSVAVTGTTLLDSNDNDITLDDTGNDFGGTVTVTSGAAVTLKDSSAIDIGASTVSGNLDVESVGALTDSGILDVGGDACFKTTGAGSHITVDQLDVDGAIGVTTTGAGSNATVVNANGVTFKNSDVTGDLGVTATVGDVTIPGGTPTGITVTAGGTTVINAEDNFLLGSGAVLDSTGDITVNIDEETTDSDANLGGEAVILGEVKNATNFTINGGDDNDTFFITPSLDTKFIVDGGLPVTPLPNGSPDGDSLVIEPAIGVDANTTNPVGDGTISFSGASSAYKDIDFTSIENSNIGVLVTVDAPPAANISEGGTTTLTGSFTNRLTINSHTLEINWGDANAPVTVFALPPTSSLTMGGTFTAQDGSILEITNDPVADSGEVRFITSHRYLDDGSAAGGGNGTPADQSTIVVTVTDNRNNSDSKDTSIGVTNVNPVVDFNIPISESFRDAPFIITDLGGTLTDVGLLDTSTMVLDWQDGSTATFAIPKVGDLSAGQTISSTSDGSTLRVTGVDPVNGTVTYQVTHVYLADGSYDINITVTDDDGGVVSETREALVYFLAPNENGSPGFFSFEGENSLVGLTSVFNDLRDGLFVGRSRLTEEFVIGTTDPAVDMFIYYSDGVQNQRRLYYTPTNVDSAGSTRGFRFAADMITDPSVGFRILVTDEDGTSRAIDIPIELIEKLINHDSSPINNDNWLYQVLDPTNLLEILKQIEPGG